MELRTKESNQSYPRNQNKRKSRSTQTSLRIQTLSKKLNSQKLKVLKPRTTQPLLRNPERHRQKQTP